MRWSSPVILSTRRGCAPATTANRGWSEFPLLAPAAAEVDHDPPLASVERARDARLELADCGEVELALDADRLNPRLDLILA